MTESKVNLAELLDYIPCSSCTMQQWRRVARALYDNNYDFSVFDRWSASDPARYKAAETARLWQNMSHSTVGTHGPASGATITYLAKLSGWTPSGHQAPTRYRDYTKEYQGHQQSGGDAATAPEEDLTQLPLTGDPQLLSFDDFIPGDDWSGAEDMKQFLRALFKPDEKIGYCLNAIYDTQLMKWKPGAGEVFTHTAAEVIKELETVGEVEKVFSNINASAGGWIRVNPVDGELQQGAKGMRDTNTSDYRYCLVECDDMDRSAQLSLIRHFNLPCRALVSSGSKSIHAVVCVDASDRREYDERVKFIYQYCRNHGLNVDENNKNPCRYMRLPGLQRGEEKQFLISTAIGAPSFAEWKLSLQGIKLNHLTGDFEKLAPELIKGVLREGHKLQISGASKAGKSFLMAELCIAIAEGREWLGRQCSQGRVLYLNLENDARSSHNRFERIYEALEIPKSERHYQNIDMLDLRGIYFTVRKLSEAVRLLGDSGRRYKAIIVDPLYKIFEGEENSASDAALFCNQLTATASSSGAAVVVVHHWSKSAVNNHQAVNRSSGSGVFQRDYDALMDFALLETSSDDDAEVDDADITDDYDGRIICRVNSTLRDFPELGVFHCEFKYPVHEVLEDDELDLMPEQGSRAAGNAKSAAIRKRKAKSKLDGLIGTLKVKKADILSGKISFEKVCKAQKFDKVGSVYQQHRKLIREEVGLILAKKTVDGEQIITVSSEEEENDS